MIVKYPPAIKLISPILQGSRAVEEYTISWHTEDIDNNNIRVNLYYHTLEDAPKAVVGEVSKNSVQSGVIIQDYTVSAGLGKYSWDIESFEQFPMSGDQIGKAVDFIIEQMEIDLIFFDELPISLELPLNVDLKVITSPPGVKGDTAQGATKLAELETGFELQVPLFVDEGDTIKVDTRTGEYVSRA